MRITVTFNKEQTKSVLSFAKQVNMPIAEFCKRAVFYAINDAYKRAEEAEKNGTHDTTDRVDSADTGETRELQGTDPAALADQADETTSA